MLKSMPLKSPTGSYHGQSDKWADFVELLCVFNLDAVLRKSELQDRLADDERPADDEDEADDEDDLGIVSDPAGRGPYSDTMNLRILTWFEQLAYRAATFQQTYPFEVDESEIRLASSLSWQQKTYIFLLLSSNLRLIDNSVAKKLSRYFEDASEDFTRRLLPATFRVHRFKGDDFFKGNIWTKIDILARALGEKVLAQESDFSPNSTGDKGLDIVAWCPFADAQAGIPIFFGQCACTDDWKEKKYSSSASAWQGTISFSVHPMNLTFIPMCFRKNDGSWLITEQTASSVTVDRPRLLSVLENGPDSEFAAKPYVTIVDEFLQVKEALV